MLRVIMEFFDTFFYISGNVPQGDAILFWNTANGSRIFYKPYPRPENESLRGRHRIWHARVKPQPTNWSRQCSNSGQKQNRSLADVRRSARWWCNQTRLENWPPRARVNTVWLKRCLDRSVEMEDLINLGESGQIQSLVARTGGQIQGLSPSGPVLLGTIPAFPNILLPN